MALQLSLLIVGAVLLVAGVALLSLPVALIVAGAAVAAFALFWDFGGGSR